MGRHLAQASVWIMVATMVATMDIEKPVDPDGKPIDQEIRFSTGLSSHPGKFGILFKARSEQAMRLLTEAAGNSE